VNHIHKTGEGIVGTRERRERERMARRKEILDAARKLFWSRGYSATTVNQIADALELAPGTIYLYFDSKEAIYLDLLLEGYELLLFRLEKAVGQKREPAEKVRALVREFFGFAVANPEYFDIIFFTLQKEFGDTRKSGLAEAQIKLLESKERECMAVAANAVGGSPEKTAVFVESVWSMLAGVVFFWRRAGEKERASVMREAEDIVMKSL
jgi:AcrR family transcriptional regulator